jgi:hypothetical protein
MTSSEPDAVRIDRAERERRRRAAELLGDLLPTTASDDTDEGWNEGAGTSRDDEYLRDVPPHHG